MKIENLNKDDKGIVGATVTWEDSDRPVQRIYFKTEDEFAGSLSCNPHAFLVACILPALRNGEKRIWMDKEICPELLEGLNNVMSYIRHWYYDPRRKLPSLETSVKSRISKYTPARAGLFLSGGIDSLAALRRNRLKFPLEHDGSFKDAFCIFGQNIESDNNPETFKQAISSLAEVTNDAGIKLIPVYTNIRDLDRDTNFFLHESLSALLAAVAHAFGERITVVSIASSEDIPSISLVRQLHLKPLGSHPLLDAQYSSFDLNIKHDGISLSRLTKTGLLADWHIALRNIRVCGKNWPGLNCGVCEKCVRTMLELLAVDALDKTVTFPQKNVTAEMLSQLKLRKITPEDPYSVQAEYLELISPLAARGRQDLVEAITLLLENNQNKAFLASLSTFLKRNYSKKVKSGFAPAKTEKSVQLKDARPQ
jgi:hypothetical protein